MKFKIIGRSSSGGVHGFSEYNFIGKSEFNCKAECFAEYVKGDDVTDENAIDFVIRWDYLIYKKDVREYRFDRTQHYRVSEMEIPVTYKDLQPVVEETYLLLKGEVSKRSIKHELLPLDTLLLTQKSLIVEQLKKQSVPIL